MKKKNLFFCNFILFFFFLSELKKRNIPKNDFRIKWNYLYDKEKKFVFIIESMSGSSPQSIGSMEKPYSCDFCGRQFTKGSNLRRHLRVPRLWGRLVKCHWIWAVKSVFANRIIFVTLFVCQGMVLLPTAIPKKWTNRRTNRTRCFRYQHHRCLIIAEDDLQH